LKGKFQTKNAKDVEIDIKLLLANIFKSKFNDYWTL